MKTSSLLLAAVAIGAVVAGTISLSASGAMRAAPPPPTDDQVADRLCRAAIAEIAAQQGAEVAVRDVELASHDLATFDEFVGLTRAELRDRWQAWEARGDGFQGQAAARQAQFERQGWTNHVFLVDLAPPFRSSTTAMSSVSCSIIVTAGVPLHQADIPDSRVRINGATVLEHRTLRLPL